MAHSVVTNVDRTVIKTASAVNVVVPVSQAAGLRVVRAGIPAAVAAVLVVVVVEADVR